jgi:hypothetical protein
MIEIMETRLNKRTGIANKNRNMYTLILYKSINSQSAPVMPYTWSNCLLFYDGFDPSATGSLTNGASITTLVNKVSGGTNATIQNGTWTSDISKSPAPYRGLISSPVSTAGANTVGAYTNSSISDSDGNLTIIFLASFNTNPAFVFIDTSATRIAVSTDNVYLNLYSQSSASQTSSTIAVPPRNSMTPIVIFFRNSGGSIMRIYTDRTTNNQYTHTTINVAGSWSGRVSFGYSANFNGGGAQGYAFSGLFGHFSWYNTLLSDADVGSVISYLYDNAV